MQKQSCQPKVFRCRIFPCRFDRNSRIDVDLEGIVIHRWLQPRFRGRLESPYTIFQSDMSGPINTCDGAYNGRTAVWILRNIPRLCVNDCLDESLEIVILGEQFVKMGELIAGITKPLRPGENFVRLIWVLALQSTDQDTHVMSYKKRGQHKNILSRRIDSRQLTPVTMKARLAAGSKYLTVVSSVDGKVFSNNRARSGSLMRVFMSSITLYSHTRTC